MKFSLPNSLLLLVLFALPKALLSQCGSGNCPPGSPAWSQSLAGGCIAFNEFELDCASGTMPNGPSNDQPPSWCTTIENNIFYLFTASAGTVVFDVAAFNCQGGNGALQAAILDCNLNFVSDCFGNIPSGTSQAVINTTPLTPGDTYLLMLDGSAGSICDFIINGAIPAEPTGMNICVGGPSGNNVGTYTANQSGNWTINPPNAGNIVSPNPGPSATVEWVLSGSFEVCISVCPNGNASCLNVEVGENEEIFMPPVQVCLEDSDMCGNTPFQPFAPGVFDVVDIQPNGECETITTCTFIVPTPGMSFEEHAMCVGESFDVCGFAYYDTQLLFETCEGPNGCDSMVTVNLISMDPTVIISDPIEAGCGANWVAIISAADSPDWVGPFYDNTVLQWTGPGPINTPNQPIIEVTVPGTYCFTITHTTLGVTCTDTECIDVQQTLSLPDPPTLTGPTNVCGGMETYTVSPVGNTIPDGYTWTTPAGVPFTNQGNFSIVVNWANSNGGMVCVTADNFCGSSAPTCINVTVGNGPATPVITGPTEACAGDVLAYEITNPSFGATCTWTVPPGASFNVSGNTINVDFDGASSGNVCVTCMDQCGTSGPTCIAVTVENPPAAPTFTSGPNQVCATDMETYCVNADPNATSWSWTSPAGNFPNSPNNCLDINWTGLNGGNICVTANNDCGSSPQTCFNVAIIPSPTAVISGQGEFCANSGGSVNLSIALTGTAPWTITYTLNNGAPITESGIQSSPFILNVTNAGTYQLVSVTDGGICPGTVSGSAVVTENPLPTATLSGSGDICLGSGTQANLTITLTGAAPWQVVYVGGNGNNQNLTINTSPFTLPIGQGNAGLIQLVSVEDNNGCIGTVNGTAQVDVLDAPTTEVDVACNDTNTDFVVTITISNGDPSSYSVTPGPGLSGTLNGNVYTSDLIPHGNGYSFVVTDANDCNPVIVSDNIVVCDCASMVGDMDNGILSDCGDGPLTGLYDNSNEFLDGDDVQMFVLHSGNSASIVDPIILITDNPTVSFDAATMSYGTTYYLSAVVGNGGGPQGIDLSDPCLQVAQGTPVVFYQLPTATISGGTEICIGESTDLTIALTGISPWSVTINGVQENVFTSPHLYTVDPDVTTDYVLSEVEDANCTNAATGTETVTVNVSPEVINVSTACNGAGTAFTVTFEITGGDPSCYTVTPLTGTLTGNIFTSDEIPDGQGYMFEVNDCKGCPPAIVENDLVDCNCLTTAGNMEAADLDVCGDEVAQVTYDDTGEFLDADDALCFILHSGNAQSPIATNSVPIFSFDPNTMTIGTQYSICPVVGNDDGSGCVDLSDPCLSIGGCALVTFRVIPTATIVAGDDICEGTIGTVTVEFTGSGPWIFEYQEGSGPISQLEATNSPFSIDVSPSATTDYNLISMVGKFCTGTVDGSATVTVNEAPQANVLSLDCNTAATAFTVTIEISGGDPASYTVIPGNGTLSGNIFTSNPYDNFGTYDFEIDDQFGCGPAIITGGFSCDCITDAGVMQTPQLNYCIGEMIVGDTSLNYSLDADDNLIYVLHTGSGVSLGTVIETNDEPVFDYDPATMSTGVTYYISAVAGNGLPNGGVDLVDFCLSIAPGTPVFFNDLPTASISGDATICEGGSTDITFGSTGVGPFNVVFEINGIPQSQVVPLGTFNLPYNQNQGATFTLVSIEDQGTGCSNDADGSVTITVNQPVEAGFSNDDFELCDNNNFTISLFENLVGYDYGGEWTDANGNVYNDGTLNTTPLLAGTYTYTYSLDAEAPCPDDMATVDVVIHPAPEADAGDDATFDCATLSVGIGGNGTTPGMTYSWTGNVSNPDIAQPTISEAGEFVLTVTSPFGCVDMDTVYSFISNEKPFPVIESTPVSCFGMDNGLLQVVAVTGGAAPYSYSFNGGPFTSENIFVNLSPGTYSIQVKDSGGCESDLVTITIEEPAEVSVELQPNIEGTPPIADYNVPFVIEVISSPPFTELDTVIWTHSGGFNDSLFCANCEFNELALEFQTTFNIVVDENGCTDEDQITVFVSRDHLVYVPNAFSPNNDEPNETFRIFGGSNVVQVKSFLVFNRWGETVYEYYNFDPNDPAGGWDGKHRGELMNPGVFAWHAEVEFEDNVFRFYKGDVTLMR